MREPRELWFGEGEIWIGPHETVVDRTVIMKMLRVRIKTPRMGLRNSLLQRGVEVLEEAAYYTGNYTGN